ncbi:DUF4435 domain-containing protein [Vibrio parahaemolyticus]|nr:DUF4435 domain-containing protein [Vibrio parahaemolyticus]
MSEYRINEIFLNAEQLDEKILIVEGEDDVYLYDGMFKDKNYLAYAVENIEKIDAENGETYTPGCDGVKSAIEDLLTIEDNNTDLLKKHILGIVDKDVSDFRQEVFESEIVFNLDSYAIENHFISQEVVKKLLSDYTNGTTHLINNQLAQDLYQEIVNRLDVLFLISLDSLKGALDSDYSAIFGYASKDFCFKNQTKLAELQERENELLEFARANNLTFNEEFIQNVVKGKWALAAFLHFFVEEVKTLVLKCNNNHVQQCQFCGRGNFAKCSYALKAGLNTKTLKSLIFNYNDIETLTYIRQGVNQKFDTSP